MADYRKDDVVEVVLKGSIASWGHDLYNIDTHHGPLKAITREQIITTPEEAEQERLKQHILQEFPFLMCERIPGTVLYLFRTDTFLSAEDWGKIKTRIKDLKEEIDD